jgi:hypothetical protein
MTKIIAGLFAAVLMAAGLVAFSTNAQAAPDCPYTGCVNTNAQVDSPGKVARGGRAKICVHVGTDGNGQPEGSLDITVKRDKGGYQFSDGRKYNDFKECFTTTRLQQLGGYSIKAHFEAKDGSAYRNANSGGDFKVTRR